MIILALVTLVLAAAVWWALIHAPTYKIVVIEVDTTEFQESVLQLQQSIQEVYRVFGQAMRPAMEQTLEGIKKFGEAMNRGHQ